MLQAIYPIVMMLLGGAVYFVATNPKVQELGRLLWLAGAIAFGVALAGRTLAL
jgi:Na+/phosphate symporter